MCFFSLWFVSVILICLCVWVFVICLLVLLVFPIWTASPLLHAPFVSLQTPPWKLIPCFSTQRSHLPPSSSISLSPILSSRTLCFLSLWLKELFVLNFTPSFLWLILFSSSFSYLYLFVLCSHLTWHWNQTFLSSPVWQTGAVCDSPPHTLHTFSICLLLCASL